MKIFEEWVIVHEEQVRMNVIVRRALAKMHNRLVAAVFDSWNENIQEKIRIGVANAKHYFRDSNVRKNICYR